MVTMLSDLCTRDSESRFHSIDIKETKEKINLYCPISQPSRADHRRKVASVFSSTYQGGLSMLHLYITWTRYDKADWTGHVPKETERSGRPRPEEHRIVASNVIVVKELHGFVCLQQFHLHTFSLADESTLDSHFTVYSSQDITIK